LEIITALPIFDLKTSGFMSFEIKKAYNIQKKGNYYNALVLHSSILKLNKNKAVEVIVRNNAASIYFDLGLYEIALQQIEKCLKIIENDSTILNQDSNWYAEARIDFLYARRARLHFVMNNYENFVNDVEKSTITNPAIPNLTNEFIFLRVLLDLYRNNDLNKLEEKINLTIREYEESNVIFFFPDCCTEFELYYTAASKIYELLGKFDKSIAFMEEALKMNKDYKYRYGRVLFLANRKNEANNIRQTLIQDYKFANLLSQRPYKKTLFTKGIITSLDEKNGTVITATVFNDWDRINFEIDNEFVYKIGDVVDCKIQYILEQGKHKAFVKNPLRINAIKSIVENYQFLYGKSENLTLHCILRPTRNGPIEEIIENIYCYSFYPLKRFIPLYAFSKILPVEIQKEVFKKKFCFVELEVTSEYQVSGINKIKESNVYDDVNHDVRLIELPNPFKKPVNDKRNTSLNRYERPKYNFNNNGVECKICQMDEWCGTDGCPLDPQ